MNSLASWPPGGWSHLKVFKASRLRHLCKAVGGFHQRCWRLCGWRVCKMFWSCHRRHHNHSPLTTNCSVLFCLQWLLSDIIVSFWISYSRETLSHHNNKKIFLWMDASLHFPAFWHSGLRQSQSVWFGLTFRKQSRQMDVWGVHFSLCEGLLWGSSFWTQCWPFVHMHCSTILLHSSSGYIAGLGLMSNNVSWAPCKLSTRG